MIRIIPGQPAVVFAPMEGVADAPMRALLCEQGGFNYAVAEFLRVSNHALPTKTFYEHIPELRTGGKTLSGTPVQVQLLGGNPELLAETALNAIKAGATAIDLNFGCPAPTVNRHDGGATLLKFPCRIRDIVSAVRTALPAEVPVSAKLRLGFDNPDSIDENAAMAAEGGASWITVHGRTKIQGYIPPAYWGPIGRVRRALSIPVVANGEIWTIDDFRRCRDETGCEHFMIGRGALANPRLAREIARELGLPLEAAPPIEWQPLFRRYAMLADEFSYRPGYIPGRIKQWARQINQRTPLAWYDAIKPLHDRAEILARVR